MESKESYIKSYRWNRIRNIKRIIKIKLRKNEKRKRRKENIGIIL